MLVANVGQININHHRAPKRLMNFFSVSSGGGAGGPAAEQDPPALPAQAYRGLLQR